MLSVRQIAAASCSRIKERCRINGVGQFFQSFSTKKGEDEWNDAWETAWLPEDLTAKNRAPWETDVNFSSPTEIEDAETKAFVEEMNDNWDERRKNQPQPQPKNDNDKNGGDSLYNLDTMKKDYRLKKQRIHAGLWTKEIEKQQEAAMNATLGDSSPDDIDRLLDSCSEIFDTANNDLDNSKIPSSSEFKNKPDGWETTAKAQDGNIWEMSQREEDILLQEFDRRIAYSKFQIASFIKTHIFSRRRPIDGWKYMIEELGPNAKKGKGSVARVPSLSDPSTQPFKEDRKLISHKGRYLSSLLRWTCLFPAIDVSQGNKHKSNGVSRLFFKRIFTRTPELCFISLGRMPASEIHMFIHE